MGLALDEQQNEEDKVVESNGIKIIYTSDLEEQLEGLSLDFKDDGSNEGFYITGGNLGSC